MDTAELIRRCVARDNGAWERFVRTYEGLIIRSVRYKLKKSGMSVLSDEFRDIVQEVFLSIWEGNSLSSVRDIACLEHWLILTAMNKTSNYCKKKIYSDPGKFLSFEEDISSEGEGLTLSSIMTSKSPSAFTMAEDMEMKEILKKEIDRLGHKQQLALKLSLYDCKKQKEIAGIMNVPKNTVSTMIRRAKLHVKDGVEKYFERKTGEGVSLNIGA